MSAWGWGEMIINKILRCTPTLKAISTHGNTQRAHWPRNVYTNLSTQPGPKYWKQRGRHVLHWITLVVSAWVSVASGLPAQLLDNYMTCCFSNRLTSVNPVTIENAVVQRWNACSGMNWCNMQSTWWSWGLRLLKNKQKKKNQESDRCAYCHLTERLHW